MTNPKLETIEINNYRSINGEVAIPLAADTTLIYGPNGSGKSSVMSAIELAATGRIAAFERAGDSSYRRHLHHRGTDSGRIALHVQGIGVEGSTSVSQSGVRGKPVLPSDLADFFSDRVHLSQTSLARLLEMYAPSGRAEDSTLVQFVKELVGIDALDALIDGLDAAVDLRRTRKASENWASVELQLASSRDALEAREAKAVRSQSALERVESQLRKNLQSQHAGVSGDLDYLVNIAQERLASVDPVGDDAKLAAAEAEIGALGERIASLLSDLHQSAATEEQSAERARQELDATWAVFEGPIRNAVMRAAGTAVDVAAKTASQNFQSAVAALQRRREDLVSRRSHAASIENEVRKSNILLTAYESELADLTQELLELEQDSDPDLLVSALESVLQFLSPDATSCPVCDQELANEPIRDHIEQKLNLWGSTASSLAEVRARIRQLEAKMESQRNRVASYLDHALDGDALATLDQQLDEAGELLRALTALAPAISRLTEQSVALDAALAREASQDSRRAVTTELAERLRAIAERVGFDGVLGEQADLGQLDLLKFVRARRTATSLQAIAHQVLVESIAERERAQVELRQATQEALTRRRRVQRLEASLQLARSRKDSASALHLRASRERTMLLDGVFGEQLNYMWREFFARLVPSEPYTPRFKKQSAKLNRTLSIELETVDREGNVAASPGAMLSFGNLNTAALSLFMAVHFAARPALPWLLLDDPIQSMDEVHVANFAATLKQVVRQQGRQVVITLHQKELFDYLALELTPGSPGETLGLVTLDRTGSRTVSSDHTRVYEADSSIGQAPVA